MKPVTEWNVAISGLNNFDDPAAGPGAIACLREDDRFQGRIVGIFSDLYETAAYLEDGADAVYMVESPAANPGGFLQDMARIAKEEELDAMIPGRCMELPLFAGINADALPLALTPSMEVFRFNSVLSLMGFARTWDLPVPAYAPLEKGQEEHFPEDDDEDAYPFEIVAANGLAHKAKNRLDATFRARSLAAKHGWPLMTRKLPEGEKYWSAAVMGPGGPVAEAVAKQMYVEKNGSLWTAVTCEMPELRKLTASLLKKLSYHGPGEVEWHVDRHGQPRLLSLNPVLPSWSQAAAAGGANLPMAILEALAGHVPPKPVVAAPGKLLMRCIEDVTWTMADFARLKTTRKRVNTAPATS